MEWMRKNNVELNGNTHVKIPLIKVKYISIFYP